MNPICFYHSADLDGVCSGAIVKHFVPNVELVGFDYGQEFPWDKVRPGMDAENDPLWAHLFKPENGYESGNVRLLSAQIEGGAAVEFPPELQAAAFETFRFEKRTVYMCDVSLPPADMKRLAEVSNLVVIDHHKTLIDSLARDPIPAMCYVDARWSGCELAWMYFTGMYADLHLAPEGYHKKLPEAVRLLGRYDVWAKDDPEWEKILAFQYGMRAIEGIYDPYDPLWELTFIRGDDILDPWGMDLGSPVVNVGAAILRYQTEVNRRACETGAHEEELAAHFGHAVRPDGCPTRLYKVIACNTIVFNSQFFDGFYDPEKHDVMCAYCQLANGKWKVSLYSTKPEIDCGAICKTFGGGGHKGAAGFICDKLPWEN